MGLDAFACRCELMNNYLMCLSGILAESPDIGPWKDGISGTISRHTRYVARFPLAS